MNNTKKLYVLTRDSGYIFNVSLNENDCFIKLHKMQSASVDHAIRYEGYAIKEINLLHHEEEEIKLSLNNETLEMINEALNKQKTRNTIGNREKHINNNIEAIQLEKHGNLLVMEVYTKDEGYQTVISNYNGHIVGDITN